MPSTDVADPWTSVRPPSTALLTCVGPDSVEMTGFGRGQFLQTVGATGVFVVTFAQLRQSGTVVLDPGLTSSGDIVSCTRRH